MIRMKRPEPELYEALKKEKLFGLWENSLVSLKIACTGSVLFTEYRNAKVFNKDEGGDISSLDIDNSTFIVSGLFGKNLYHYRFLDENRLEFLVGKRAEWLETAKFWASGQTMFTPDRKAILTRSKPVDCDKEPQSLGEVFKDMDKQLKAGNFEVSEP